MRHRKPVDLLELHDWLAQDLGPLHQALSDIWTRGDQECVRLANAVVDKCVDIMGAGTELQPADSASKRVARYVVGERWTPEMLANYQAALKELAVARKQFAEYARRKMKREPAELFTLAATGTGADAAEAGNPQLRGSADPLAPPSR